MTTALATVPEVADPRQLALLKAVGLDRLSPEQKELALNIAARYELDLLLKHMVMIDGRPYITRDGLLHVAHRSGQLDGIETTEPTLADGYWRSTCSVYRKDMSRPFTYTGRYPESGQNKKFAPEMAVKVGEVMSLRRAFDVAAPAAEERWDTEGVAGDPDRAEPKPPPPTLAERVAEKAAEVIEPQSVPADASEAEGYPLAPGQEALPLDGIAPTGGLTVSEFKAKASADHVQARVVAAYVKSLFGEVQLADLTDAQRQDLWDAIPGTAPLPPSSTVSRST